MVASVKGSGIGQVKPIDIASGGITGRPTFTQNLQSIVSGQGVLPNTNPLSPVPGGSNIGLNQVPSTGLPNILPSETVSELMQPDKGLGESILDAIIKPEAQTAFGDLVDSIGSIVAPTDGFGNLPQRRILEEGMDGPSPEDLKGSLADQQAAAGRMREQFPNRSDDFIYGEGSIIEDSANKGFKAGMDGPEPEDLTKNEVPGADNPAKKATVKALDEYLKSTRPGVAPQDYAEYMKEFADATGLDISGQPDNSQALMAFGLALMQNKAGKGFDVGQILSATGAAGEKALPELAAARKEARAIRAKAGEYALGRKKEDQAAAMNREGYYILPAGASGSPQAFIDAVTNNRGRHERLNAYELNSLDKNEEFNKQYDIIPAERYEAVVQEVIKASNKGKDVKSWLESPKKVSLFGSDVDAPEWAKVDVFYRNPNSDERGPNMLAESGSAVLKRIDSIEQGLIREEAKFKEVAGLLETTDISQVDQFGNLIVQTGRNLGILDVGEKGTNLARLKYLLKTIEVSKTATILGEAGKTLSDVDRQLVRDIVGQIDFANADEGLLKDKMREIYSLVITKGKNNINAARTALAEDYGVGVGTEQSAPSGMTQTGEDSEGRPKYKLD
tara:strand:+ start:284 stop:2137 length:1854 start_codon:yes stop_codon:yes gene_type:complete